MPQMKINLRQEIAMWVLGLLWTALGFAALVSDPATLEHIAGTIFIQLILLVPVCLIIFSLRTRHAALPEGTRLVPLLRR
jgi:hypothetical protein